MPPLRLDLTLETVTPLFLAGADPRGTPELRPPSLRGALRYWLRAAVGGMVGDDVDAVRRIESAVFGSAGDESGSASAVTVRLVGPRNLRMISYSTLAEGDGSRQNPYRKPGLAYLLFAARRTGREQERSGLQGTFGLSLMSRPGAKDADDAFKKAYASLWLLTHLGAVGNRSRRGAGALQMRSLGQIANVPVGMPSLLMNAQTPPELAEEIGQGLTTLRQQLDSTAAVALGPVAAFDVLHPTVCKLWVVNKSYKGWNEALDEVGRIYQRFRSHRAPDYATVKSGVTSGRALTKPVERAAFGLPIPFYYRSPSREQATLAAEHHDRRASPLWIRIARLRNNQFAVVLVWFRSLFLPSGERLKLSSGADGPTPTDALISTFLTGTDAVNHSSLKDKGLTTLEVTYA